MPRIDKDFNDNVGDDIPLSEYRFMRLFRSGMGVLFIAFGLVMGFSPVFYGRDVAGEYSLFLNPGVINTASLYLGYIFIVLLFLGGLYFIMLGFLNKLEKIEKLCFFGYLVVAAVSLIFGIILGATNSLLAMMVGVLIGALTLLLLYIDYKLFSQY